MFRRRKLLVVSALVCLALGAGVVGLRNMQKEKPPLFVDGKPVTREELEFYNGDTERAVRGKVVWNWAEQEGLVDEFSYDIFLKELKEENQNRRERKEEGEPVYGPVEFTPMQYYKRLIGSCEQALKEKERNEILDSELISFYKKHKENYRQVDSFTADYTVWQEGRITYQETLEINDSNVRAMTEADEELANKLLQLEEGGETTWNSDSGETKRLVCTKREPEGYLPYEEVSGAVLEQCMTEKFEKELSKKIAESEVLDLRRGGDE